MSGAPWRAVLRIARRDARRAKGRSALIIAMIALPVLGITSLDVLARTYQLSDEQQASRDIGAADIALTDAHAPIVQYDDGGHGPPEGATDDSRETPISLATLVPPGSRVLPDARTDGTVAVPGRSARVGLRSLAYDDPLAHGIYRPKAGRAPRVVGEVALTEALAGRLRVHVGDQVDVADAGGASRVVGVVADGSDSSTSTALLAPGALDESGSASFRLLVDLPTPLDAGFVQRVNAQGVLVTGRTARLPGTLPAPYGSTVGTGVDPSTVTAVGLVAGMALLEIVLLAGPAFAVGVKRQSRDLALLSAVGGQRRDVARVVLGGGLVLGTVAGVLGVAGGVLLAFFGSPLVRHVNTSVPGPFDPRPLEVAAITLVGVGTAVLASLLPARIAVKQDVVAALTGRRGILRSSRRVPLLGLVAVLAGTFIALEGGRRRNVNIILAGSVVAELGLVAVTPVLVGAVGRLGRLLSVAPRLALRDASRNRSRTAPAVAAILAAVAGSVAVATVLSSVDAKDRRAYEPAEVPGSVSVGLPESADAAALPAVQSAVNAHLPVQGQLVVHSIAAFTGTRGSRYLGFRPAPDACLTSGCHSGYTSVFDGMVVGDARLAEVLSGASSEDMVRVLARGGVVVPRDLVQADGTALAELTAFAPNGADVPPQLVRLPAAAFPDGAPHQEPILSEAAAATLAMPVHVSGVLVQTSRTPTQAEQDRTQSALSDLGVGAQLTVERGYHSNYGVSLLLLTGASALLVLGASGIATGLAAADGRADLSTLAAVGATPGLRRRLAGAQSLVTAGLGTGLGVIAGLVPAIGLIGALNTPPGESTSLFHSGEYPLVMPWENLLLTIVVVPLVAAGAAVALTRSRLPLVRRPA